MGTESLQVTETSWDIFGCSSIFSAACSLFQLKVKKLYDICLDKGVKCPHHEAYKDGPGKLVSHEYVASYVEVHFEQGRRNVQDFFDCEFNSFGKTDRNEKLRATEVCGSGIVIEGKLPGCDKGKRMVRREIMHAPHILEIYCSGFDQGKIT